MKSLFYTILYKFSKRILYITILLLSFVNFTDYARTTESLPVSVSTELVISENVYSATEKAAYWYFFLHSPAHYNFQSISADFVVLSRIYSNTINTRFIQQKLNQYSYNHYIYSHRKIISSEVSTENPPNSQS